MPPFDKSEFEVAARAALNAHEASEIVRRYQQGLGRPIISTEMNGFRIVAVGKTIKWSKAWRFFTDFLLDHLKDVIGRPWAVQAQREGKAHPIFTWLKTMGEIAIANRASGESVFQSSCKGHLGALWRLGYALYLIEHNDTLDHKIVRRLRLPVSFRATYHETQIASAFAVSGFKLKMAELGRSSVTSPEFWATRGGYRYAIEAKCKDSWKHAADVEDAGFKGELRQWLRDQIYASSLKRLRNAVYCFELSLFADLSRQQWETVAACVREVLAEAQNIKVKGEAPLPAYVIVTNNADVLGHQEFHTNRVAMLFGFNRDDWFENGENVEIEAAFDSHDKHRDIHTVFKCFEEIDELPQSFDGLPVMLDENGKELTVRLKLGMRLEYPNDQGGTSVGTVYELASAGREVWACVEAEGQHDIVKFPLEDHEIDLVEKYGDAVFGKPIERKRDLGGDPFKFYDWILSIYQGYGRESLLIQVAGHRDIEEFRKLSIENLRVRAAREVTKAAMASSGRPGQV